MKVETKLHLGYGDPLPTVVLSQTSFSRDAWAHLCHKFGVTMTAERVLKIKIQSSEYPGSDDLYVTYVFR